MLTESLALRQAQFGKANQVTADSLLSLAALRVAQKRWAEAMPLARACSTRQVLLIALCVFSGNMAVAQSSAPVRQHLKGHVTEAMTKAPLEGRVPPTTQMTLTIGLVIPNMADLVQTAAQIADPNSPSYRKHLTPEQFADPFGAKDADYQAVLTWAHSNNLKANAHRNRFVVTVEGAVADIEPALSVHMNYGLRADGTQFFSPDAEPTLALTVPVEHIGGLDNFLLPVAAGGSGKGGTYQGTDLRNAYAAQITMTGACQKIGI